ncbi:von Willebrand factor A domain-containing protein 2 isoform X5 [Pantherophis guttatus]|uniref:von Willebrand factor A domain-containing protein 2 isoform X5 n=1 Tax=Pantherophis guttatus TaxID=94885 RepID=A0A6P9DUA1_PANGU|nr:von Willebrand factor A domain-containing protein 2 isoform X5 [Pantherophis guttatus]
MSFWKRGRSMVFMNLIHFESLCTFLLSQVFISWSIQELQVSQEIIEKISAASQLMNCSAPVDILFLLDGSYSIGKASFERSKYLTIKLCDALDISPEKVRVGAIQFSNTPHLEFPLDAYFTKHEIKDQLKKIMFKGGRTETCLALDHILQQGFRGGRNSSVSQILIILTDGRSQYNVSTLAQQIKEKGIAVFAIGVNYPRWEELYALASEPVEHYTLFAEDTDDAFNGLYTRLTLSDICNAAFPGCRAESHPCERKTLERVKELVGNYFCWKGSQSSNIVRTSLCPFYKWRNIFIKYPSTCYRTICSDPCDSHPCQNGGTCIQQGLEGYHCVCPVEFGGDSNCGCLSQPLDLVFALDSSASTGRFNFVQMKNFVSSLSSQFGINRDVTQVSLVVFGKRPQTVFGLDTHVTSSAIQEAIKQAPFMGGSASVGSALLHIHDDITVVQKGARPGVKKVVVVITSGAGVEDAVVPAQQLRSNDVSLLIIVTERVQMDLLLRIAGSSNSLVRMSSYEDLRHNEDFIMQKLCDEAKMPVNICKPNPCMNYGICIPKNGNYWCQCQGWEGPHCENRIRSSDTSQSWKHPAMIHTHLN